MDSCSCNETLPLSTMTLMDRGQLQFGDEKYVARIMKCLPDKFIEMCHMHLAFLLDLSGDKLELLLSTQNSQKKKKASFVSVGIFKKKDKLQPGLFGLPLTDEGVCLMVPLIKFLKMDKNLSKEGLFRKPGNKSRMTTLRELLVTQGPSVNIDPHVYSPYDVACVLKEFLRELPEPLLTERHLEAHRQILALGHHASASEEIARYACKKLSALQLLMLLLPSPAQKLTMHLTKLLQRITDCPDSKMTSATLGTIFAPIYFIDRKVDPSELCSQVADTAPAVSFMIEKAHDLFHAPRELVIDLVNYWSGLGQTSAHSGSISEDSQMKKSLSGRTLNTTVCYLDQKLSRCDDITGNTQAELASLLAHVQSMPNTPQNIRLKKQIMKTATTPVMSEKKPRRNKSISASIKKRLPHLSRMRTKKGDLSSISTSSSSSTDSKTTVPKDLHGIPSYSLDIKYSQQPSLSGQKRNYTLDKCDLSAFSMCTPPKQICRASDTNTTTSSSCGNIIPTLKEDHSQTCKISIETLNMEGHSPAHNTSSENHSSADKISSSNDILGHTAISENTSPFLRISGEYQSPSTKTNNENRSQENMNSAHLTSFSKLLYNVQPLSTISLPRTNSTFIQLETKTAYLPPHADNQISSPVMSSKDRTLVSKTHHQPYRKQGTPIMPRAVLRMVNLNTPDSSF